MKVIFLIFQNSYEFSHVCLRPSKSPLIKDISGLKSLVKKVYDVLISNSALALEDKARGMNLMVIEKYTIHVNSLLIHKMGNQETS